jgi:hypothetical protein
MPKGSVRAKAPVAGAGNSSNLDQDFQPTLTG